MIRRRTTAPADKRLREAARWYVRHESDDELTSVEWQEWEEWTADSANCAEYEQVVQMHRQTQSISRPMLPSHEEIRADVPEIGTLRRLLFSAANAGQFRYRSRRSIAAAVAGVVLIALVVATLLRLDSDRAKHQPSNSRIVWQGKDASFSESTLEGLRAAGRPVLVNLRAAWCGACVANERTLSSEPVRQMMVRKHVAYLEGDWTNQNPAITTTIQRFGRDGVPLYLLYCPGSSEPRILPQKLTEEIVLSALSRLPDQAIPST